MKKKSIRINNIAPPPPILRKRNHESVPVVQVKTIKIVKSSRSFNHLRTKSNPFHLKTQSVPRSKHLSLQLQKSINAV
jgi:hypothetical protein